MGCGRELEPPSMNGAVLNEGGRCVDCEGCSLAPGWLLEAEAFTKPKALPSDAPRRPTLRPNAGFRSWLSFGPLFPLL